MRTGVNFASAGSGFDEMTSVLTETMPMSRQLVMFRSYLRRLSEMTGEEEAARIVGNALMFISAGTNDFLLNYYDIPTRKGTLNMSEYQDFVLRKVEGALKVKYFPTLPMAPCVYFLLKEFINGEMLLKSFG